MHSVRGHSSVNRPPTPDANDTDLGREPKLSLEETIRYQLYASGERERLKRLLVERLTDCGWKENIKDLCKEFIERKGRDNISVDDIVAAVRPAGRQSIPDSVKAQLLAEIRKFITSL